eukprot:4261863-Amphidinium_carterae.1
MRAPISCGVRGDRPERSASERAREAWGVHGRVIDTCGVGESHGAWGAQSQTKTSEPNFSYTVQPKTITLQFYFCSN